MLSMLTTLSQRLLLISLSLLCLLCLLPITRPCMAQEQEQAQFVERLRFKFDDRQWKPSDSTANGNFSRVTYLPEGQTSDKWTEKFRYQRTVGILLRPGDYYKQVTTEYSSMAPRFFANIITQGDDHILFEWGIKKEDSTVEYIELQKYMLGKSASHIIRYNRLNANIPADVKADWVQRLKDASIDIKRKEGSKAN